MKTKEKNLAAAVAARIEFLKKVTDFAEMISAKRGERLHYSQGSCNTNTIYELHDFADFSFHADTGQCMFGGNQVKIWYHPGCKYADFVKANTRQVVVLDISWGSDVEKPTYMSFIDGPNWQREILRVIRNWESIATKIDREAVRMAKKNEARAEEARRNFAIAEAARRLQVS